MPVLMQDQCPLPQSTFPPLPAFAPLVGQRLSLYLTFTYTLALRYLWDPLIPLTAASSEDESEEIFPRSSLNGLNAPIEALCECSSGT
jgi:hypothetical protein